MSVIQRIRDKGAWIIFGIIALALIAFILQDSSFRRGNMFSNTTTIGSVNGTKIERADFENKIDFFQQMQGGQAQRSQLMGSVWDYMVQQELLNQQINKLGLAYGPKELSDQLFGDNPPSWLTQAFTDPNTGVYNAEAAKQQFAAMKKKPNDPQVIQITKAYLEPTISQGLAQKYQSIITGAVYVPKWLAEKTNTDNSSIANISYVYVPYSSINDSTVKVTDEDINAYVNKHAKEFDQEEETRTISYVTFDATPSSEDSAQVRDQLNTLKQQFEATNDVQQFLVTNSSQLPYYNSYIAGQEIKQSNKDSIFTTPVGGVYGPYLDQSQYALAKMVDKRSIPDSVKVRHILVLTEQQQQGGGSVRVREDSTARKILDSAIALIQSGVSFDSVAAKYSDDPGSKNKGGVYDYFPSGRMVASFNDFAFTGKTGEKKVVQTEYGFHYVEILGQKGSTTGYKIAYIAKPLEASSETVNSASNAANQFAANSRDAKQFTANAKQLGKEAVQSPEIKENDYDVSTLGENRQLVKWSFENKVGDVSEPFEIGDKYVVAMITGINKKGIAGASKARPQVENIVRNEKKAQQIISTKIKGNTLESAAQSSGTSVQRADSIAFQTPFIPAVGNEPKIVGAAFNKQIQNKVSSPIAASSGVFVIKGEGISAKASLGANAETIREGMQNTILQQVTYQSLQALRKAATVKDYRSTFY